MAHRKTDHSKGVKQLERNATGDDFTAGNSVTRPGTRRSFQNSVASAAVKESKRTKKSQIRKGRGRAIN